jgi:hypothetical protein
VTGATPLLAALPPFFGVVLYVVLAALTLRLALRWAREAAGGPDRG